MKKLLIFLSLTFFFLFTSNSVYAGCTCNGSPAPALTDGPTCQSYSCNWTDDYSSGSQSGSVTLDNPIQVNDFQTLIGKVIAAALGLVGSLALAMFIYGGFTWMTAMGNSEKVKKGRDTMVWAALGLVVIFSAYGLVRFVLNNALQLKQ